MASRSQNSFRLGYKKGRNLGYEQGKQEGWNRGYAEIMEAFNKYYRKILVVTPSIDLPSLEIIIVQPLFHLQQQGHCHYDIAGETELSLELIEAYELIIFLRCVEPEALEYLRAANRLGKKTVYAIDDNFIELPKSTSVSAYYMDSNRIDTFSHFLREAQLVKTGAPYFADYIRTNYNAQVVDIPDSFDTHWVEIGGKPPSDPEQITIGYEGTVKDTDFTPVIPALTRLLNEYGNRIKLQFHGFAPEALLQYPQVTHEPVHLRYRDYIRRLYAANWDIGLAPLADTTFNICKTNNKYREYSSCGIAAICSRSPVYEPWIEHGQTGYLVDHTIEGWYAGLKHLIEDRPLREHIKEESRLQAKQKFAIEVCAERWREQILMKGGA